MKTLYTIQVETNDGGWDKSDKVFITSQLANKYMRNIVADKIRFFRNEHIGFSIFKSIDNYNTNIIVIEFIQNFMYIRQEFRVCTLHLFSDENDFNKFPIKF